MLTSAFYLKNLEEIVAKNPVLLDSCGEAYKFGDYSWGYALAQEDECDGGEGAQREKKTNNNIRWVENFELSTRMQQIAGLILAEATEPPVPDPRKVNVAYVKTAKELTQETAAINDAYANLRNRDAHKFGIGEGNLFSGPIRHTTLASKEQIDGHKGDLRQAAEDAVRDVVPYYKLLDETPQSQVLKPRMFY